MSSELRLLVGTERGLERRDLMVLASPDGGESWSAPEIAVPDVEAHKIRRGPDGAVYVGTRGNGLLRSPDGLGDWTPVDTPPAAQMIRSLCSTDERLLVGTEAGEAPVGVYAYSEAAGWETLGDLTSCSGAGEWSYPAPFEDVHVRHISVDPYRAGRTYAAVQVGGIGISPDGGKTWYDRRNLDLDVHMVEPAPGRPGVLYAGCGRDGPGMWRSTDYGETWEGIAKECGTYVVEFAFAPNDPNVLYWGAARTHAPSWADPGGAQGEMFRSDDGGDTWRKLGGGLPELMESRINVVYVDPADPDGVYFGGGLPSGARKRGIAKDAGVYYSPDRGETWRQILSLDAGEPLALHCIHV